MEGIPVPDLSDSTDDIKDISYQPLIRSCSSQKTDIHTISRISCREAASIITGERMRNFDGYRILDCRFCQEYTFGHIIGATNLLTAQKLFDFYKDNKGKNICVLFHCEFSHDRAPQWAEMFRTIDRSDNLDRWPEVSFPNTFIIDGGFQKFHAEFPNLCCGEYVPMLDERIRKNILREEQSRFKNEVKGRTGIIHTPPARRTRRLSKISIDVIKFNSQPTK